MNELQPVALEAAPADVVVRGGRVYAGGSFLERDVAIRGDRIAALLEDASTVVGAETTVVDATDRLVLPGLIDAHCHADTILSIDRMATRLLETGTTAIVSESSGLGTTFGARGVEALLEVTADAPVSVFLSVPPQLFVDTFEPMRADEDEADALLELLTHERIVAVGEIDWIHVVGRDSPVERLVERAEREGVRVVGHGAGCTEEKLRAFATVVDNDHEAITADGVRERATNGIHVVGRCGSIRDDLGAVVDALPDVDPSNVSLSTDGLWPEDLTAGFGMAEIVRRTIDAGVEPSVAIDAATKNPARHFGLSDRGVVEPGAIADLAIVSDFETMDVECVLANGSIVVADGELQCSAPDVTYPEFVYDSVDVEVRPERFTVPESDGSDGIVRAVSVEDGLLTGETTAEPAIEDGNLLPAPGRDVLAATVFDRDPFSGNRHFTGFLTGFGLRQGAVATTMTWELPSVLTVAADVDDAVVATERVASMGGGFAVARDGEIVADLPFPIGGGATDAPVEDVAEGFSRIRDILREAGVTDDRPLLTLQTLTFPGVPALKLCASGYADLLNRTVVGLDPDASRSRVH